ncbi:MAG: response regulator [Candidatus Omnitrophota bacterium]
MAKKILVIDDDVLVLRTLKKLLTREGYLVETAKEAQDVNQAVEKIRNTSSDDFNLIICDIRMPGTDGTELIAQIKESRRNENKPEVPVIFITGYANEEASNKAIKLGAKDYVLKPFDIDKLLISVKSSLENGHARA